MKYAIVVSSVTGNTKLLADKIKEALPEEDCIYFGETDKKALEAEKIYVGFWTDCGTCDKKTAQLLNEITTQRVFLFGTAGFMDADGYWNKILKSAEENLHSKDNIIGEYMCQGKMQMSVRERYEKMDDSDRKTMLINNFDEALKHPNEEDFERLKKEVLK